MTANQVKQLDSFITDLYWPLTGLNHTSWMTVVTPTNRPKSKRNRSVTEVFCEVFLWSLYFFGFRWRRGFCNSIKTYLFFFLFTRPGFRSFVIRLIQISSSFTLQDHMLLKRNSWMHKSLFIRLYSYEYIDNETLHCLCFTYLHNLKFWTYLSKLYRNDEIYIMIWIWL